MENIVKIDKKYLEEINLLDNTNYFGNWVNNISILNKKFSEAIPFDHIVIDNFLNEKYANELYETFPNDFNDWCTKLYSSIENVRTPFKTSK